jgi:ankyrin repeat protein
MELFDDAGSYPRQQLLQLLHLPNVRTVRYESNPSTREVCVEIQPNTLDDYVEFLQHYDCGEFRSMLQSNIKVNGQTFFGRVDVEVDQDSVLRVLKCLHPTLIQRHLHKLKSLIKERKFEELCQIIESEPQPNSEPEHTVPNLTSITATKIYKHFLKRNDLAPYEYLRFLKKQGCSDCLEQVRSMDGYNALHLAIKMERDDHMKMLFYNNNWGCLRNDIVQPVNVENESLHAGYTPRRLAEAFSYKTRGFEMINKFDRYDLLITHMEPVSKACLGGSLESVSALVDTHPYLMETKDENHSHCLFYACASGNARLVEFLIAKGVPRNVVNCHGETPLHITAMFGHLDVLEVFARHMPNFLLGGKPNKYGYCAVHYCAMYGDIDALKLYKQKGIKIDPKALTIAAKHRRWKAFQFILSQNINVNLGENDLKRSAIQYVVINGNPHGLKMLIEKGADITVKDKYEKNLLHLAAEHGHEGVLQILINEANERDCLPDLICAHDVYVGHDLMVVVRGKDRGRKAWHWVELKRLSALSFKKAMASGQVDVVNYGRILISGFGSGPDRSSKKNMEKRSNDIFMEKKPDMTPLHLAALRNWTGVVQYLLANGAPANAVDSIGATPMHYAAMNDNISAMQLLSSRGGSFQSETYDGKTPFTVATENMNALAINFLKSTEPMGKAKVSALIVNCCVVSK